MPIYEYKCRSCGEKFEQFRSMSDDDSQIECPECGTKNPQRVLSTFSTGSSSGSCAPSSPT